MTMFKELRATFNGGNLIRIRDATVQMLGTMLLRQALLTASGALLTWGAMSSAWLYAVGAVLLFIVVAAYGLVKGWLADRDAKRMADALPDTLAVVVRKGDK